MEIQNTLENKARFFAQYWMQMVFRENLNDTGLRFVSQRALILASKDLREGFLQLKPLSSISDEQIKQICIKAHNLRGSEINFEIQRNHDIIHCSYRHEVIQAKYHICLNFKHATINSNLHFEDNEIDKGSSHKINIAEIHFSSTRVAGYIQCVDYLRREGFAIPFNDLSVEQLISYNWIKIKP